MTAVTGPDGLARCPWATHHDDERDYHDAEWGVRVAGEAAWFERLTLEAFQSGLSWRTILLKRPAFRAAFADFDVDTVARFDEHDVERLMGDASIVRNRRKIDAAVTNARAAVALRTDGGLEAMVLAHRPEPGPAPRVVGDVPASTPESLALSRALKKAGFAHVGPTTMYALMQATGLVDDHLEGCHRRGAGQP
ncbi:MAG: DNA-3-methyladenine glycosylase I [Nocardioides sp.]